MLTLNAVKNAILEGLQNEDMTQGEIYRYLRREMHPNISYRDVDNALGALLKDGKVREIVSRDPHGAIDGNPSLFTAI